MRSRITICVLSIATVFVAAVYAQVRVRVVGFDDEPIENVRVFSEKDFGESVANGYFDLTIGAHVVRFSKDGFRPVTKLTADLQRVPEVRLAQDRAGLWKPPVCTTTKNSSVMDGWHMRFIVPRGVKVREGSDIDYSTQTVCRGRLRARQCGSRARLGLLSIHLPMPASSKVSLL